MHIYVGVVCIDTHGRPVARGGAGGGAAAPPRNIWRTFEIGTLNAK